jgi:hypothetical protein
MHIILFGNLCLMRNLNTNPAAYGYSFHFTCQFLCLLILFIVFHTFLNLKTSNTKYILKDCSIYPFPKFHNSSLIFMHIVVGSFLDLFMFTLSCSFWNRSFKMSVSINLVHCITKFETNFI